MTEKPVTVKIADLKNVVQKAAFKRNLKPDLRIVLGPVMGFIPPEPFRGFDDDAAAFVTEIVAGMPRGLKPAILIRPGEPTLCGFVPPEDFTFLE